MTKVHDWYSWEYPTRFLEHAVIADLVGPVESVTPSMTSKPREVRINDLGLLGPRLRELALKKHDIYFITARGTLPSPFEINVLIAPFDHDRGSVDGYSLMSITFDATPFLNAAGSSRLIEHFSAIHSADDTESAFIHLRDDSYQLMYGAYRNPVTYNPGFSGIHWANFLGPGQIERFDQEKINAMGAWMTRRVDRGIFIVTGPELGQAAEPASQEEMFRLTEIFRNARKPRTPAI